MTIRRVRTARGWRLVQHGTVLSEVLRRPGPTHSVFDVLAAAVCLHPHPKHVALLGFGGGGMVAALRALGSECRVHGVDLDRHGWDLFGETSQDWALPLAFHEGDAVHWLSRSRRRFDVILDDLSVPRNGEVEKPPCTWDALPRLLSQRLAPGGFAVFNLLCPPDRSWAHGIEEVTKPFSWATTVAFREYHNRIVITGHGRAQADPGPRLRQLLRALGSRQAAGISSRSTQRAPDTPSPPYLAPSDLHGSRHASHPRTGR